MEINKVFILGKLTKDVLIRPVNDTQIGVLNLLVEAYRDRKEGEPFTEKCYIDVDTWGKAAQKAADTLRAGDFVLVTGRLKSSSWQDKKTGETRSKHTIYCENFELQDPTQVRDAFPDTQVASKPQAIAPSRPVPSQNATNNTNANPIPARPAGPRPPVTQPVQQRAVAPRQPAYVNPPELEEGDYNY